MNAKFVVVSLGILFPWDTPGRSLVKCYIHFKEQNRLLYELIKVSGKLFQLFRFQRGMTVITSHLALCQWYRLIGTQMVLFDLRKWFMSSSEPWLCTACTISLTKAGLAPSTKCYRAHLIRREQTTIDAPIRHHTKPTPIRSAVCEPLLFIWCNNTRCVSPDRTHRSGVSHAWTVSANRSIQQHTSLTASAARRYLALINAEPITSA